MPRYYGVVELPDSRLCADERMQVVAFGSRADRDAWAERSDSEGLYGERRRGERRRAVTRDEALSATRQIMPGADHTLLQALATEDPLRDERGY